MFIIITLLIIFLIHQASKKKRSEWYTTTTTVRVKQTKVTQPIKGKKNKTTTANETYVSRQQTVAEKDIKSPVKIIPPPL